MWVPAAALCAPRPGCPSRLGALGPPLPGNRLHRLCAAPATSPQTMRIAAAPLVVAFVPAIGLALWLGHLPLIQLPLTAALISFAATAGALILALPRLARRPPLAVAALPRVLTPYLASNNSPASPPRPPPPTHDPLPPHTHT